MAGRRRLSSVEETPGPTSPPSEPSVLFQSDEIDSVEDDYGIYEEDGDDELTLNGRHVRFEGSDSIDSMDPLSQEFFPDRRASKIQEVASIQEEATQIQKGNLAAAVECGFAKSESLEHGLDKPSPRERLPDDGTVMAKGLYLHDIALDNPSSIYYRQPYLECFEAAEVSCCRRGGARRDAIGTGDRYVLVGNEFTVGREKGTWIIDHEWVTSTHFRIYLISYGPTKQSHMSEGDEYHDTSNEEIFPMVYCEDQISMNGTYVNGVLIGNEKQAEKNGKTPYLLTDGDVIEIRPYWKFKFHQPGYQQRPLIGHASSIIPPYMITSRLLGAGNFGSVYLATTRSKQVACKIVNPSSDADRGSRRSDRQAFDSWVTSVRQEIDILAKLNHPNIVNIQRAFVSHEIIYIFTDLATGGDLFSFVRASGGTITDGQARSISWQLLRGVQYLHDRNIIHRDIKPENILLTHAEWCSRVILTDFGFAKILGSPSGRTTSFVGTTHFMAPEIDRVQYRGYTKAADMWSFGVLIPLMLVGRHEITTEDNNHLSLEQQLDDFVSVLKQSTKIRPAALDIIQGLLTVDERKRLSVRAAIGHKWFPNQQEETLLVLKQASIRYAISWKERAAGAVLIEDLYARKQILAASSGRQLTKRKAQYDASLPPRPTLERHLSQPKKSRNQETLERLGSRLFLNDRPLSTPDFRRYKTQKAMNFQVVDGQDMFSQRQSIDPRLLTTQRTDQSTGNNSQEEAGSNITDKRSSLPSAALQQYDQDTSLVALVDCSASSIHSIDRDYNVDVSIQSQTVSQYFPPKTRKAVENTSKKSSLETNTKKRKTMMLSKKKSQLDSNA